MSLGYLAKRDDTTGSSWPSKPVAVPDRCLQGVERAGSELDRGRRLAARRRLEVGPLREAAEGSHEAPREPADGGVVLADGLVEAAPLDRDAVLGAFELALER